MAPKYADMLWIVPHGEAEYFRSLPDVIFLHKGNLKLAHIQPESHLRVELVSNVANNRLAKGAERSNGTFASPSESVWLGAIFDFSCVSLSSYTFSQTVYPSAFSQDMTFHYKLILFSF